MFSSKEKKIPQSDNFVCYQQSGVEFSLHTKQTSFAEWEHHMSYNLFG